MNIDPTIKRPALRWYGGKWNLANWIIPYFPPHQHYAEPCFGAGSVLFRKPMVPLETINDLNGRVVNYFRMLREYGNDLIRLIELTPWAEDEYHLSKIQSEDILEDARRFHIMCWMSIQGGPVPTGFRTSNHFTGRIGTPPTNLINHDLHSIASRLRHVQILNEDAIEMFSRYTTSNEVFIYFDPPYVPETRVTKNGYTHEPELSFHIEAAEKLKKIPGNIIVSGYACPLYEDLYEKDGWTRIDHVAQTNTGSKRTESIWLNPRLASTQQQKSLFDN
jgi:DNA adenine methylase